MSIVINKVRKTLLLLPLALVATLGATSAHSADHGNAIWQVDEARSKAGFVAVGSPGFLRIKGEGGHVTGTATSAEGKVTGKFQVALDALVTGIDLRDRHMKEKYLETAKWPVAVLALDSVPMPDANGSFEGEFSGTLTMKDVAKPITGKVKMTQSEHDIQVVAQFTVKLSEYPIGVPSYLGVSVAETVDVQVELAAKGAATTVQR